MLIQSTLLTAWNGWDLMLLPLKKPSRTVVLAALLTGMAMGSAMGVGLFTFVYARGASYLNNDPATCANCHIMNEQFAGWSRGSHHQAAVCNDCHTPHDFIGKYMTKGINGYHHSLAFTTGNFHEPIQIKERNQNITEQACRSCHADIVQEIDTNHTGKDELACIRCHRSVGHLED